jgi:hypothetical protein
MDDHGSLPTARVSGLVITEAADEVLDYDTERHDIHHLNQATTVVWRMLDGRRSVDELIRLARIELGNAVDDTAVRLALTKLDDANLLDGPLAYEVRVSSQSRRKFLKRAAIAGAAVPLIASVTARTAAASLSCTTPTGRCNSGSRRCTAPCVCTGGSGGSVCQAP